MFGPFADLFKCYRSPRELLACSWSRGTFGSVKREECFDTIPAMVFGAFDLLVALDLALIIHILCIYIPEFANLVFPFLIFLLL
jgi:hypothetical protein